MKLNKESVCGKHSSLLWFVSGLVSGPLALVLLKRLLRGPAASRPRTIASSSSKSSFEKLDELNARLGSTADPMAQAWGDGASWRGELVGLGEAYRRSCTS